MPPTATLDVLRGVSRSLDAAVAAEELHRAIARPGAALVLFFCSPRYDLEVLARELRHRFGDAPVLGCTTAGEITPAGYLQDSLVGVSLPSSEFTVATGRLDQLGDFPLTRGETFAQGILQELKGRAKDQTAATTFGLLLIDGLSVSEEHVVAALYRGLNQVPILGGSAGDGISFRKTFVYHDGAFRSNSAVFALVHTAHPFEVFKTEHFVPTERKLVVTGADPGRRIVTEINGLPAGLEYARQVGLAVDKLTPLIFATHPVVVQLGGIAYVRSIQKVNDDGSLTFFCAIDEGIVLRVSRGVDMAENLEVLFRGLEERLGGKPGLVLGCDCVLRAIEMGQKGLTGRISRLMAENNVIGFSTYGEQFKAMHVNQTLTGVAIGP